MAQDEEKRLVHLRDHMSSLEGIYLSNEIPNELATMGTGKGLQLAGRWKDSQLLPMF